LNISGFLKKCVIVYVATLNHCHSEKVQYTSIVMQWVCHTAIKHAFGYCKQFLKSLAKLFGILKSNGVCFRHALIWLFLCQYTILLYVPLQFFILEKDIEARSIFFFHVIVFLLIWLRGGWGIWLRWVPTLLFYNAISFLCFIYVCMQTCWVDERVVFISLRKLVSILLVGRIRILCTVSVSCMVG
jgi:hypothetical protein